jgi:hypothetical protein
MKIGLLRTRKWGVCISSCIVIKPSARTRCVGFTSSAPLCSSLCRPCEAPGSCLKDWVNSGGCCRAGLARVTKLERLEVAVPLSDASNSSRTPISSWRGAAAIASAAFAPDALPSLPCLRHLSLDVQHVVRPSAAAATLVDAGVQGGADGDDAGGDAAGPDGLADWPLPTCKLESFALSGVALGARQLDRGDDARVRL